MEERIAFYERELKFGLGYRIYLIVLASCRGWTTWIAEVPGVFGATCRVSFFFE